MYFLGLGIECAGVRWNEEDEEARAGPGFMLGAVDPTGPCRWDCWGRLEAGGVDWVAAGADEDEGRW